MLPYFTRLSRFTVVSYLLKSWTFTCYSMSVVEVFQPLSALWYSYSLGCDRSVFSPCHLRGAVTALNLTGVYSAAVNYVGQLLLWL
jgi:hypothetical protein